MGALTAFMTAFYMTRLLWLTFFGASRMSHEVEHHVHESPLSMTGVLVVLALLVNRVPPYRIVLPAHLSAMTLPARVHHPVFAGPYFGLPTALAFWFPSSLPLGESASRFSFFLPLYLTPVAVVPTDVSHST